MSFIFRALHHGSEKGSGAGRKSESVIDKGGQKVSAMLEQVHLSIQLESPPILLYGPATESTGSILSGLLRLEVLKKLKKEVEPSTAPSHPPSAYPKDLSDDIELELVTLALVQTVNYSKPFVILSSSIGSCKSCALRETELARWDVLTTRNRFSVGTHGYPFSHLLPGSLPASCKLGSSSSHTYVKYDLIATARVVSSSKDITVRMPINIARLLLRGPDKNSLRVFPPTEVTAKAVLPNVIYPKSTFPLELKIDNVCDTQTGKRWRLRKLSWKIEESSKLQAYCCPKHLIKLNAMEAAHGRRSPSVARPLKSSNLHHSVVQTTMTYSSPPFNVPDPEERESPNIPPSASPLGSSLNSTRDVDANDLVPSASIDVGEMNQLNPSASNELTPAGHSSNVSDVDSSPSLPQEHLYLEETRNIAHGEIKSGWKSDFSGKGTIELVANISIFGCSTGLVKHESFKASTDPKVDDLIDGLRNGANCACDINDPAQGIFVGHNLVVEAFVVEEQVHAEKKPKVLTTPLTPTTSGKSVSSTGSLSQLPSVGSSSQQQGSYTGVARVLRMQFKLVLTERSGLGIAWDDEVPPTYKDVSALSPPTYSETPNSSVTMLASTPSQTLSPSLSQFQTPCILNGEGSTPNISSVLHAIDRSSELNDQIHELSL